ncbi:MAG: M1 family metallopeptidase [Ferruginibacter sp.]
MKKLIGFLTLFISASAGYGQQTPYWQQEVNYKIDVTFKESDYSLDGFIRMDYHNNSPDTLRFIWIHCWPNAYKNDRTAYTDQSLENGSTKFYFSNADKKGYINRLDFRVNGTVAQTDDHPQHQDIIKLLLPAPLLPGKSATIETPFHVKLPYAFSRGGHIGQTLQVTQWYPVPAVYDRKGWHPMPYLDQGEFYAEFGSYDVQITLPADYKVAATGILREENEKQWLLSAPVNKDGNTGGKKNRNKNKAATPAPAAGSKTLHYHQDRVHDFAWFADKNFMVKKDTLRLPSGRVIDVYAFYYPQNAGLWKNSTALTKRAVLNKSAWLGEYPYDIVTVVDGGNGGGMEYPTITLLDGGDDEKSLDFVINHEVGHNWFQGILGTNERQHPWMDEGMNTFYDNRYARRQYGTTGISLIGNAPGFLKKRLPENDEHMLLQTLIQSRKDQPIETVSEKFNFLNYNVVAYTKTGEWMELLEQKLGTPLFDRCMQEYYKRWQFKHPYPEDFRKTFEELSGQELGAVFSLLDKKGNLEPSSRKKDIRFSFLFNNRETDKHNYISFSPAVGFNFYDRLMLGGILHNYSLPLPKLRFVVAPLYGMKSRQFNGLGRISYTLPVGNNGANAEISFAGSSFTGDTYKDSNNTVHYLRFAKMVPSLRYTFANKNPRSTFTRFIQWKTFYFREQGLQFTRDTSLQIDIITYPTSTRYLNQLQFVLENNRKLYPYAAILQAEQGDGFLRFNFTGNYYFNYPRGGGMNLRLFAGKFVYLGDQTLLKKFNTDPYHLNMTGPKGYEDYTYSNYFVGRNEFERFSSQQIMIRDGGFKVGTDLLSNKVGKTDNWLAAANFTTDIPKEINPLSIFPFRIPIKAFVDVGTFAEAWKKNAETARFVYDAGLQLSLFADVVNIYVPLVYSNVYKNYYKSIIPDKGFAGFIKKVSFSIDVQKINLRRFMAPLPF